MNCISTQLPTVYHTPDLLLVTPKACLHPKSPSSCDPLRSTFWARPLLNLPKPNANCLCLRALPSSLPSSSYSAPAASPADHRPTMHTSPGFLSQITEGALSICPDVYWSSHLCQDNLETKETDYLAYTSRFQMLSQTLALLFQCVPIQGSFPHDTWSNFNPGIFPGLQATSHSLIPPAVFAACTLVTSCPRHSLSQCIFSPREGVSSIRNRTVGSDLEMNLSLQGHMGTVTLVRISTEMLTP